MRLSSTPCRSRRHPSPSIAIHCESAVPAIVAIVESQIFNLHSRGLVIARLTADTDGVSTKDTPGMLPPVTGVSVDVVSMVHADDFLVLLEQRGMLSWIKHVKNIRIVVLLGRSKDLPILQRYLRNEAALCKDVHWASSALLIWRTSSALLIRRSPACPFSEQARPPPPLTTAMKSPLPSITSPIRHQGKSSFPSRCFGLISLRTSLRRGGRSWYTSQTPPRGSRRFTLSARTTSTTDTRTRSDVRTTR